MADIPPKINISCSNSYLLDERQCLGTSFNYINYNYASLSAGLVFLEQTGQNWNRIFSIVSTNSANWASTTENVLKYTPDWTTAYNTVSSLSASWTKDFAIYYPKMLEINTWYGYSDAQKNTIVVNWMNINFPPTNYTSSQKIYLYINLYRDYNFTYSFYRSYNETCTPNGGGGSISCTGCARPHVACNWNGRCFNGMDYCSTTSVGGVASIACVGLYGKALQIGLSRSSVDRHVARIIRVKLSRTLSSWVVDGFYD
jgi:hypothetical protein